MIGKTDRDQSLGVDHPKAANSRRRRFQRLSKRLTPYLLLLPAILLVGGVLVGPMVRTVWISLWEWPLDQPQLRQFVGLTNYSDLIFESAEFRTSLAFTAKFTVITIVIELVLAFAFALLLDSIRRGRALITTIAVLPFMVAPIAVGLIWRLMFQGEVGLINHALEFLGFEPIGWLSRPNEAMWATVISEAWATMPFVMLILVAGLASIPQDVLNASQADGASPVQQFRYIILPLLMPSFTVALVFQTVIKIRVFDLIFILTEGGPGGTTVPIGLFIYRHFFRFFQVGHASAASVILLIIGAIVSLIYVRILYRQIEY